MERKKTFVFPAQGLFGSEFFRPVFASARFKIPYRYKGTVLTVRKDFETAGFETKLEAKALVPRWGPIFFCIVIFVLICTSFEKCQMLF